MSTATVIAMNASCADNDSVLNRQPNATAPVLPPAPTMPDTEPSARRLMNGTTKKVAPSDICTNRLNTIIEAIASGGVGLRDGPPDAPASTCDEGDAPVQPFEVSHRNAC